MREKQAAAAGGEKMNRTYGTAIVLAAGSGRRMGTKVHKQYLLLGGRPVLYYSLKAFQDSEVIDEIILVCGSGEEEYCRTEIVDKYGLSKVSKVIPGGSERYESVWNGLQEAEEKGFVFIHDGARPFVDREMLLRAYDCVRENRACVAGMPAKDTIKIADERDFVKATPDRRSLWIVQTPQVFETKLVKNAYSLLMRETYITVTDDAMVVERMLNFPIKMFQGSYENIKITTPEDLDVAEVFLKRKY